MVLVEVPEKQLQPDHLAAALRGASASLTAGEALGVLASTSVDVPAREDLLSGTVTADDIADPVRGGALRALAGTHPDRALALARDLRDPGERLALAALTTLGRLGGPDDVAAVARLADAPEASPLIAARAGFARTLLVHRFGLEDLADPPAMDLLPEPGSGATEFVSSATGAMRAAAVIAAVQRTMPELSSQTHLVLDVACRGSVIHLILRRDLQVADGLATLSRVPAVIGVIASAVPEHNRISADMVILSRPTADGLALSVTRTTGEPTYAGTAAGTPDGLTADLRAVRQPGAAASRIRALVSQAGIEVFGRSGSSAAVPPRVPERRPEADPSSTPPT
jgi:hypothetical protein